MKKGFKVFCWAVLGFFAFCALIATFSDDDNSASPTEQKQETEQQAHEQKKVEQTEAERQAREQKEEAERQAREQKEEADRQARAQKDSENKKAELAKKGHDEGYKRGFTGAAWELRERDHLKRLALQYYTTKYETPTNSEEKELCDIFVENYIRGWEEGFKTQ